MKKVLLEYLVILIINFQIFYENSGQIYLEEWLYEGINVYAKENFIQFIFKRARNKIRLSQNKQEIYKIKIKSKFKQNSKNKKEEKNDLNCLAFPLKKYKIFLNM